MSKKISLKRAALWGAVVSPILLIVRYALTGNGPREDLSVLIGYALGAVGGGALLFVAAAAIINAVRR